MYPVRRQISPHAAPLRRDRTDCENRVWQMLRNRQIGGYKFRFQATIGRYVVDFLCVEAKLVVEIDGGQHSVSSDMLRTRDLEGRGYCVIRFGNSGVLENLSGVLETILSTAQSLAAQKKTLTQPSPAKAGEGYDPS